MDIIKPLNEPYPYKKKQLNYKGIHNFKMYFNVHK